MSNPLRIFLMLFVLAVMIIAGNPKMTTTYFLDLENSNDNALVTINNWYDLGWYWRKSVSITNSGGALSDYQVKVDIDTAALVSAGKMQADGDDIRFTTSNGTTEIPYWIESGINTSSTIIWVRIPSIPVGSVPIYIYYSNTSATASSNLTATFPEGSFADSFADITSLDSDSSSGVAMSLGDARLLVEDGELKDVEQSSQDSNFSLYDQRWLAQTFYPTVSGYLTKVTIRADKDGSPPNPLVAELRNDDGSDSPGSSVYATASRNDISGSYADYDFSFNIPPYMAAGTRYGVVIKTTGGDGTNRYRIRYQNSDIYSGGRRLQSTNGGTSWSGQTSDTYFTTYAATAAVLDQNQAASNTDGYIYGSNRQSQSFLAGQSGNLSAVRIYASAFGSPPNDLVVEVRDAEEYVEETLDQSQTSYSTSAALYGGNWSAQTFRTVSSGNLSKVTLRASKTGSPPSGVTLELRDVAAGTLEIQDQSQTSYAGDRQVYSGNWFAQIFQAGLSDILTKITLRTSKTGSPSGNMTVEVRNAVLNAEENLDQSQTLDDAVTNVYGVNWAAQTFSANITGDLTKIIIRLIRNENSNQTQSSYTGDRQVYSGNWLAQIFRPSASASLGQVFLRAGKTGAPSGNLTLQLRDANIHYSETADQSQPSYDGERHIFSDNWTGQTFYAGVSGNMTKVTLRASKTGSPSGNMTVELRDISGGETLDQTQTVNNSSRRLYDDDYGGQIFTANMTGTITKVALRARKIGSPPDPLIVEIRDENGSDLPGTTVYASTNLSAASIGTSFAEYEFTYSSPASVTSGTKYAIVVRTANGDIDNSYQIRHQNTDVYSGGRRVQSNNGGTSWTGSTQDTYFITYVDPGSLPGATVYASASRSDVSTAGDYDFSFTTPYSITSGSQYALVVYTIGGDGSNYYSVFYESSDAYGLGRECLSENGGTNWTGSDSTDSYFGTYIYESHGYFPGETIYASTYNGEVDSAGEYSFVFSSPYSVVSGTDYALVVSTGGGDGSNYYSVSYQNTNVYANGRELSSTDSGSNWTASDSTDLYFRTVHGVPLTSDIIVQIRNVVGGLPGSTVYATATKEPSEIATSNANYEFVFASPASVTAGVDYAIVVKTDTGDSGNRYRWRRQSTNVYADGNRVTSSDGGSIWTAQGDDFYFETYVTASSYIPGSTVHASTSRGDITSAGEYEFTYSSPYSVTSGTRYAIVAYTSGGDGSNYYVVSYQDQNDYSAGREASSTNSGGNWTGSDSTDLFFRTYVTVDVGDTPGDTVYASTSRGDITSAGDYDFTFLSPYSVTDETNYSLVAYTTGGDAGNYYSLFYEASDAYGLGKMNGSSDNGTSWLPNSSADIYFKTYITNTTGQYVPGSTLYASANRSDIGSVSHPYTFFFASPATISSGTIYTLVFRTTDGDASNYYAVAYQNVQSYSNGERSTSSDGGTSWSPTGYDVYFFTYVFYDRSISASGILHSVTIPVDTDTRLAKGIQLSWNGTEPANTDVVFQLEYYNGSSWALVPNSAQPGNSTGFSSSPVDITSVLSDYSQVRIKLTLSSTNISSIPTVQDWALTYYYRSYASPEPSLGIGSEE